MNRYEKDEIRSLPPKYRPMGAWEYFGYSILYAIPLIGFIMLIVFACSGSNIARRSHARSYFCFMLLGLIINRNFHRHFDWSRYDGRNHTNHSGLYFPNATAVNFNVKIKSSNESYCFFFVW